MKLKSLRVFRGCSVPIAACVALLTSSCGGSDDDSVAAAPAAVPVTVPFTNGVATTSNVVAYWNKIATDTINVAPTATGTAEEQRPNTAID